MTREPVTLVEIDVDTCALTFGVGACTATLGGATVRKCFDTYATCAKPLAFSKVVKTLRFAESRAGLPKGAPIFPALVSVSSITSTVNISGADDNLSAFGRRATVSVEMADFAYHDRFLDPYQAERISGAAQIDEGGYDPATRGTFFAKLRARWPYYAGRALRVIQAEMVGGALVNSVTRNYIITSFSPPDDQGRVKIEASDILDLASNDRALCPKPGEGYLLAAIDTAATALTLTPTGIGAKYAASGRAVIGSEIVSFTRAGDVVTLTGRGLAGTTLASHAAGDTLQPVFYANGMRFDDLIESLLVDYAGVPAGFVPVATWAAEITRWMPDVLAQTHICTPTGVAKLIGELAVLGLSIWWDEVAQTIGLKCNRPPFTDPVYDLTENANLTAIETLDRDDARLTEVLFFTVQKDPTKSATDADNFRRAAYVPDLTAKGALAYGDTRTRKIFCRWLNDGNDSAALVLSSRLLKRFSSAPTQTRLRVDWQDKAIGLTDVLRVSSKTLADATGKPVQTLMQVISRSEPEPGHEIELIAQAYQFSARYGAATANDCPVFSSASETEKATGEFACDDTTLKMPDGSAAYEAI
jgi:hypothetical protein